MIEVMPTTISLNEVAALARQSEFGGFEVFIDRASARRVWHHVFLMALSGQMTDISYRPWLGDGRLTYRKFGQEFELMPPPDELSTLLIDEARSILGFGRIGRWFSRESVSADFTLELDGYTTERAGTAWKSVKHVGVEFFRIDRPAFFPSPTLSYLNAESFE